MLSFHCLRVPSHFELDTDRLIGYLQGGDGTGSV